MKDLSDMYSGYEKKLNILIALLTSIFLAILIRTAWISDDAAITLRTVLNFLNDYGPRFNVDERVQAYTHPLWFLLISATSALSQNVFYATFFLSIAISTLVFWLLLKKFAKSYFIAAIAGCILIFSKAFVDFSTSGLENPLSHLIILGIILVAIRLLQRERKRDLTLLFTMCSLLYLNRPDLMLIPLPLIAYAAYTFRQQPKTLFISIVTGFSPIAIWTIFSLYYYGFPFPNTAYAKLGSGIAHKELFIQGCKYFLHSLKSDPLTIFVITLGLVIGFQTSRIYRLLAIGVALYLFYIASIGGDFMEGRFFTAPLLISTIIFTQCSLSKRKMQAIGLVVIVLGTLGINATLLSNAYYTNSIIPMDGIADERGFYYQKYGLLAPSSFSFKQPKWVTTEKGVKITCGLLGYYSIFSGPGVHWIDTCGLADPLLARMPAIYNGHWRIGHFIRQLPLNYEESIQSNSNLLSDPATNSYWESIRIITRAPLNDQNRILEVLRFNFRQIRKPDSASYHQAIVTTEKR